jgi:hypothetical protein
MGKYTNFFAIKTPLHVVEYGYQLVIAMVKKTYPFD